MRAWDCTGGLWAHTSLVGISEWIVPACVQAQPARGIKRWTAHRIGCGTTARTASTEITSGNSATPNAAAAPRSRRRSRRGRSIRTRGRRDGWRCTSAGCAGAGTCSGTAGASGWIPCWGFPSGKLPRLGNDLIFRGFSGMLVRKRERMATRIWQSNHQRAGKSP